MFAKYLSKSLRILCKLNYNLNMKEKSHFLITKNQSSTMLRKIRRSKFHYSLKNIYVRNIIIK